MFVNKNILRANSQNIVSLLKENFNSELLNLLYFIPKKVDNMDLKLNDMNYINKVLQTIHFFQDKDVETMIKNKLLSLKKTLLISLIQASYMCNLD